MQPHPIAAVANKSSDNISKEILLITDGEVYDWKTVTKNAAKSDHRFFTVGVGSSVSEAFLQTLADSTGGATSDGTDTSLACGPNADATGPESTALGV